MVNHEEERKNQCRENRRKAYLKYVADNERA